MTSYCPEGSEKPLDVTSGWYTTGETIYTRSGQKPCQPGSFCLGGVKELCPAGTYSSNYESTSCTPCPIGSFCERGSPFPTKCKLGTYASYQNMNACTICPLGNYCPEGSISPLPCSSGKYGDQLGLKTSACSQDCINDHDPATIQCHDSVCREGFYCPTASTSSKQMECGDPSGYCPSGSKTPILADPGYYTVGNTPRTAFKQVLCEAGEEAPTPFYS